VNHTTTKVFINSWQWLEVGQSGGDGSDPVLQPDQIKKKKKKNHTLGDFKVGVSVGVYCTKCTLNTGVNTNSL
jgi:hypothetical protein